MPKIWCLLLLLSSVASCGRQPEAESRKPNVVFIMADDLGWGHLGSYGQQKIQTPNLDRLAAEGLRFTQAYAGAAVCAPSRSVLMTGRHNGRTPIRANGTGMYLYDEDLTVAELLQQAGYATGGFGKWGLGDYGTPGHPNRQGFDELFGQLDQVHAHFYYPYWVWHNGEKYPLPENQGEKQARYVQDEIHAKALDFIRRHQARPFFAYLSYILPHVELTVPEDSEEPYHSFAKVSLPDPRPGYLSSDHAYATFAGMISRLDRQVGDVMALLQELGLDENTLLIFTSDNGAQGGSTWQPLIDFFQGNGPLRGHKSQLYEGGIRVPLIARWTGKIAPGRVTDHLCYFPDVLPTLAELAGVEAPAAVDGISFLPVLLGREGDQRSHDFLYWSHYASHAEQPLSQAVRMENWKGIQPRPEAPLEVYNLESDLGETENLSERQPDLVEKLTRLMADALTERRRYEPAPQSSRADFVR